MVDASGSTWGEVVLNIDHDLRTTSRASGDDHAQWQDGIRGYTQRMMTRPRAVRVILKTGLAYGNRRWRGSRIGVAIL